MCDNLTIGDNAEKLAASGLSRRDFAAMAAAGVAFAGATAAAGPALSERMVTIHTPDATPGHGADAFFVHPAGGRHPGIILWPDIAGLREAYKVMARRLAGEGFAVLAVNHYYRTAPAPLMSSLAEWMTAAGQAKMKPAIAATTPAGTLRDAAAFVSFLDGQRAVARGRGIGACGYCMTGGAAVRTAAAVPKRVHAAASLHGANLVSDAADSPHRLLGQTQASFLFAIARNDDARAPGDKLALRAAADAAHRPAEVEVYNADHGWCTLDAPANNHAEAERAWARMVHLFRTL